MVRRTGLIVVADRTRCPPACGRRAGRRGGALVETALVLPLMLLFLLGIMEYGRYFFILQLVTNAAREGCRYAVTHTSPVTIGGGTEGNATSDVTNWIGQYFSGPQTLSGQAMQVYQSDSKGNNLGPWNGASPGQFVCVQITGNFQTTVPKLLSFAGSIPIRAQCVMFCEGN